MLNKDSTLGELNLGALGGDLMDPSSADGTTGEVGLLGLMEERGQRASMLPVPQEELELEPLSQTIPGSKQQRSLSEPQLAIAFDAQPITESVNQPIIQSTETEPLRLEAAPEVDPLLGSATLESNLSDDNFALHLTFDEVTNNEVSDLSPNGQSNPGVLENGATVTAINSVLGNAVQLDGIDDFVSLADSVDINLGNHAKRTLGLWFRLDELGPTGTKQVIYEEGAGARGLSIYADGDRLYVGGWNLPESDWQGTFLSTDAIQAGQWHHVTLVLDAEPEQTQVQAGAFSAYLDGTQFGEGEGSQLWEHESNIGLGAVNQGTRFHDQAVGGTGAFGMKGAIAEARLYNRVLSDAEIATLATLTLPVFEDAIVHLTLDEAEGTTALDQQSADGLQSGTLVNGAAFSAGPGLLSGVVQFDGQDDYIALEDSPEINLGNHHKRSIAVWFKADVLPTGETKQVIYEEGGGARGLNIYLQNQQLYVGGWNIVEGDWQGTFLSTNQIQPETWHHVSLVLDAEENLQSVQPGAFAGYLDGVQFGTGDGAQLWSHGSDIGLGAVVQNTRFHDGPENGTAIHGFDGEIGDFQLYNRALSTADVATLATGARLPEEELSFSLSLGEDTSVDGQGNTDRITRNPEVVGTILGLSQVDSIRARFAEGDGAWTDVSSLVQSENFQLTEPDLAQILGRPFRDGDYTLTLEGLDTDDTLLGAAELRFTLDRTAPELVVDSPLVDGLHSIDSLLLGQVSDSTSGLAITRYSLDGENFTAIEPNGEGQFQTPLDVAVGQHQLTVEVIDLAGNKTAQAITFSTDTNAVQAAPAANSGWGGKTATDLILGEQGSSFTQATLDVALGQTRGSRTIAFDITALFDPSDDDGLGDEAKPVLGDRLLVYLINPENGETLLDQGTPGSAVFELSESSTYYQAGLVRYDGTRVEIDVTSLGEYSDAQLVFQLLNQDSDQGSVIQVRRLSSTIDEDGTVGSVFPLERKVVPVGEDLDLGQFSATDSLLVQLSRMQVNETTGQYQADLQIVNMGDPVGRQVALVFENLPAGVSLKNASGVDAQGNPYLNISPSLGRSGLDRQGISDIVALEIENPNQIQFDWQVKVLAAGANQAPILDPVTIPDLLPGEVLKFPVTATDPEGDVVTFSLRSDGDLPTGMLKGNGILEFRPTPDQLGTYTFEVVASDGTLETTQTVTMNVVADPVTTTRVSGIIQNVEQQPLVGVVVEIGDLATTTDETGAFTIESNGPLPGDTLKVRGEAIPGDEVYPFIPEKLTLVLGHDVYEGVNNVIDRPIYLPALDVASGQEIDPSRTVTVITENIQGAAVTVAAGSLKDQSGGDFDGVLSITEVPTELTPAALPPNLLPDLVVTIQPGEMVFESPAPLSLPNRSGYAPGVEMDLWSINPLTGDFDKVGIGRVSEDGSVIQTVDGGIRNSSWHFFTPFFRDDVLGPLSDLSNNPKNQDTSCPCNSEKIETNSEVELHSGVLTETHNLASYQSLGQTRGLTLTYDSLRANPKPIVNFSYDSVNLGAITNVPEQLRLVAKMTVNNGDFTYEVPGYKGETSSPSDGENYWTIPSTANRIDAALQADLKSFASGKYTYSLRTGVQRYNAAGFFTGTSSTSEGEILHINSVGSVFGNGWGLAGLQELVENADGSILLIDGDGSEMLFDAPLGDGIYQSPPADFSTLKKNADGTFTRTLKDQTVYQFNSRLQLVAVTDRNGNQTQYQYNPQHQIETIIDPVGLETHFTYANGRVSMITDPQERKTLLRHDPQGNLIQVSDPDQTTRTWGYDSQFHLISEIDKRGNIEESFYNFAGRVIRSRRKDGSIVQINPLQLQGLRRPEETVNPDNAPSAFVISGTDTTHVDGNGNVIRTTLNQVGQVVSRSDGEGSQSSTQRNESNLVDLVTDSKQHQVTYAYDDKGNVTSIEEKIPSFRQQGNYELFPNPSFRIAGRQPEFVKFGDINGDGIRDAVIASKFDDDISVVLGQGDGQFKLTQSFDVNGENGVVSSLEVGDLNQDGRDDIIIGSYVETSDGQPPVLLTASTSITEEAIILPGTSQSDPQLSVYYGVPEGVAVGETYKLTKVPSKIYLANVDSDADLDLLVQNRDLQRSTSPTPQDPTLALQQDLLASTTVFQSLTTLQEDIALTNDNRLSVFLNESGIFNPQAPGAGFEGSASDFAIGDLNLDGQIDLVSILNTPADGTSIITTYLGQGSGVFQAGDAYTHNSLTQSLQLVDLNNDSYLDAIFYPSQEGDAIQVALGDAAGQLTPQNSEISTRATNLDILNPIHIIDHNEDGIPDLLITQSESQFQIVLGTGNGDFNELQVTEVDSSLLKTYFDDLNGDGADDALILNSQSFSVKTNPISNNFSDFSNPIVLEDYAADDIAIAQVTGDSNPDLVIAYGSSTDEPAIDVLVGNERHGFSKTLTFTLPIRSFISELSVLDLNKDGYSDIYVAYSRNGDENALLYFGNHDGDFETIDVPYSSNVIFDDITGDGITDGVFLDSSEFATIYVGRSNGGFGFVRTSRLEVGNSVTATDIADINGDGFGDLIITERSRSGVAVYLSKGDGFFQEPIIYELSDRPKDFALGDINQDSYLDLVVSSESNPTLTILMGNSAGEFEITTDFSATLRPVSVDLADINNDGYLDVLALNSIDTLGNRFHDPADSIDLSVFYGQEDSSFSDEQIFYIGDAPRPVLAIGDFSSDGFNDLVFAPTTAGQTIHLTINGQSSGGAVTVPEAAITRFSYDPSFSQMTSMTDALGRQVLYEIDPNNGNMLSQTRVVGELGGIDDQITRYTYTPTGQIDRITDPLGRVTDYTYNALGRMVQVTFALGTDDEATQQFDYDDAGNLTLFIDENGNRTQYQYDPLNRLQRLIEADPDGDGPLSSPVSIYTYDENGNLYIVEDARGNLTTYEYDQLNRQTVAIDAFDEVMRYAYDKFGNVISETDERGHTTHYRYDTRNRLIETVDPEGAIVQFSYDTNDNLIRLREYLSEIEFRETHYLYDVRNRLIQESDALGKITRFEYDKVNNLTAISDRNGNRTQYRFDDLNRRIEIQDALNQVSRTAYDLANNLISTTDELGRTMTYDYDARNRLTHINHPIPFENQSITYTYDDVGNLRFVTDELGRQTEYVYDALNRQTAIFDPLRHQTQYEYDANDNLTAIVDDLRRRTSFVYDKLNRQTQRTDAIGGIQQYRYDPVGNLTDITDELQRTTRFTYDPRNLLTQVTDPLGHTTTNTYDLLGRTTAERNHLGHTTTYQYDFLDRLTETKDALGERTSYTYDPEGNLLSLTDAENNTTSYVYDELNRRTSETTAFGTRSYVYNPVSLQESYTDRNGRTRSYTYDQRDRLTNESWLDASDAPIHQIDYTYNAASELTQISDNYSRYSYRYDAAGRLEEVDNQGTSALPNVVFEYGYDSVNNRTSVADTFNGQQQGLESFIHDPLNRVTRITQEGASVTSKRVDFTYDPASQMTGSTRYANLAGTNPVASSVYEYDLAGRLTDLTHSHEGNSLAFYKWEYDAINRITKATSIDGTNDYTYNDRDELLSSDSSYQQDESYGYDGTGNRTNTGYETGQHNRLLNDGTYSYTYDAEGNRQTRTETATGIVDEYTWDYRNRLTAISTKESDGTVIKSVTYTYDAYGRRIEKVVDGDGDGPQDAVTEAYVYDGDHIALVFDGDGNLTHRYLHGPQIDQVLAEETADGEVRWALADNQGTIRDVIDSQGNVLNHITYDSFGQITNQTNTEAYFRFGYTGREFDQESGQYFYRARYFDPQVGRFISEDPIGFRAGDANVYRYVENASTLFTDPLGLFRNGLETQLDYAPSPGLNALSNTPIFYPREHISHLDIEKNRITYNKNDPRDHLRSVGLTDGKGFTYRPGSISDLNRQANTETNQETQSISQTDDAQCECPHEDFVYRGDGRPPSVVFNQGLEPWDKQGQFTLREHVHGISERGVPLDPYGSQWVSTSKSISVAKDFGNPEFEGGFVYTIKNNGLGVDVDLALRQRSPEQEVAFQGTITSPYIKGARRVNAFDQFEGPFIPNPFYKGCNK